MVRGWLAGRWVWLVGGLLVGWLVGGWLVRLVRLGGLVWLVSWLV